MHGAFMQGTFPMRRLWLEPTALAAVGNVALADGSAARWRPALRVSELVRALNQQDIGEHPERAAGTPARPAGVPVRVKNDTSCAEGAQPLMAR